MDLYDLLSSVKADYDNTDSTDRASTVRTMRIMLAQFAAATIVAGDDPETLSVLQDFGAALATDAALLDALIERADGLEHGPDVLYAMLDKARSLSALVDEAVRGRIPEQVTGEVLNAADELRVLVAGMAAWDGLATDAGFDLTCSVKEAIEDGNRFLRILEEMEETAAIDEEEKRSKAA